MSTPLDYTQTPELLLLELINYDNGTAITSDMVTFSEPQPVIEGERNTVITVSAAEGSPFEMGSQDLFYNRIALPALGALAFLSEDLFNAQTLLAAINSEKLAYLYLTDLEDFDLPQELDVGEIHTFNLTARPSSIRWMGEASIEISVGLPNNIDVLGNLFNEILSAPGYLT